MACHPLFHSAHKTVATGHTKQEKQGSTPWYLISRCHQQNPKSPDGSCDDPIYSVVQREAQQEEETSIQKEA